MSFPQHLTNCDALASDSCPPLKSAEECSRCGAFCRVRPGQVQQHCDSVVRQARAPRDLYPIHSLPGELPYLCYPALLHVEARLPCCCRTPGRYHRPSSWCNSGLHSTTPAPEGDDPAGSIHEAADPAAHPGFSGAHATCSRSLPIWLRSFWIALERICEIRDSVSSRMVAISCSFSSSK